jgi:fatty acid desaturase
MEHNPPTTDRPFRIPPIVWVLGFGLIAALAAVFIFKVAVSTVVYYGFIALMIGGHFFMHGSHGGHGSHTENWPRTTSAVDPTDTTQSKDKHTGHSGGCH